MLTDPFLSYINWVHMEFKRVRVLEPEKPHNAQAIQCLHTLSEVSPVLGWI